MKCENFCEIDEESGGADLRLRLAGSALPRSVIAA